MQLLGWLACSSGNAAEEGPQWTPAPKHPSPAFELTSYEGELCPPDSLGFSANNGAFTLTTSTDSSGTQSCELHIRATIPAGYALKRPVISSSGYALREEDSAPPTQVALTYQLSGTSLTSQHEVPSALTSEEESDSYVLVDTPNLAVAACSNPSEPEDADLTIKVEATIPDGTTFRLTSIDGEFDFGVQWYECPHRALE